MNRESARVRRRLGSTQVGLDLDVDTSVPALVFKVGSYPLHAGGVGAIRSLGRLGVPVYAITEPGHTPAAASRYCTGRFVWRTTVHECEDELIADLRLVADQIGRRSVIVPTDDEAAVLVAEHAAELDDYFLLPAVAPGLPRRLASKPGLAELCQEHHISAPESVTPVSMAEVTAFAAAARFPAVIKNAEPWERRRRPVVPYTTVVHSPEELLAIIGPSYSGERLAGLILQEYIPVEHSQDWAADLYRNAGHSGPLVLTGVKLRSWPPAAGATACAYSVVNPEVAALTERFCKEVGYSGIADLDWRLDLRDGQYKLVDFNPRIGGRFRLNETESGVDVVRAMHLDLTGRQVPQSPEVEGRRLVIEHVDVAARFSYRMLTRRAERTAISDMSVHSSENGHPSQVATEYAWMAGDDPGPFVAMLRYAAGAAVVEVRRQFRALSLRVRTRVRAGGG